MKTELWTRSLKANLSFLRDYAALLGGSAGRLVLSLAYFVCIANALSVSDFGLFATASATGVVLSRVAGLGYVSPLYRAATVSPDLVGTHTAGLLLAFVLSLPLVLLGAAAFFLAVFAGEMALLPFAAVVAAEVLCWRTLEVVVIVNNGMNRFARGAMLVIAGSALRAAAALLFVFLGEGSPAAWALCYLAANAAAAVLAVASSYPRQRLQLRLALTFAGSRDSLSVAGAEILFYLQSELDKLLVLSLGGPQTAGIYAIVMRLVDLTALPVRSFNTMLVQKLMTAPQLLASWRMRWSVETGIAAVSTAGIAFLGGVLHVFPGLLGDNVAEAAPLVLLALLVPAFRNLVEYQNELLYARGRTAIRALILGLVGSAKAAMLVVLLREFAAPADWILGLNGLFFAAWALSAGAVYAAFDWTPGGKALRAVTPAPQLDE